MAPRLTDNRRDEAQPPRKIKLKDAMPARPPLLSWRRPAWALHRVGHLVPRRVRHEMFVPSFLDIYTEFVEGLAESRATFTRMLLLARFMGWAFLLARECYKHPFHGSGGSS